MALHAQFSLRVHPIMFRFCPANVSNFQKLIDNFHMPYRAGYAVNPSLFEMIMGKRTVRLAISEDVGYLYPLQVYLTASLR